MDLSIGDLARRTGLTHRTLRYYEELGLLDPPRDTGGRRRYDAADIRRLYRIRLLRDLGTPLSGIELDGYIDQASPRAYSARPTSARRRASSSITRSSDVCSKST